MSEPFVHQTVHQTVADDGVEIVGRVEGQGPPLVVPATASDQPVEWEPLAPHLTEHFTCYVMDRSSRARQADEPDHSFERLVGDVVAFVESVGEPAGLFGMSWGGILAVGAAQRGGGQRAGALGAPSDRGGHR